MGASAPCCSTPENEGPPAVIFEGAQNTLEGEADARFRQQQVPVDNVVKTQQSPAAFSDTYAQQSPRGNYDENTSTSIAFEFIVNGEGAREVLFSRKPLGMTFANKLPLTVTKVVPGTEAETTGVKAGWIFSKVAGVSLDNMDLENILTLIQEKSRNLPTAQGTSSPSGTTIVFEFDAQGVSKAVTFYRRPLGMTFANKLPLTVTKIIPGSEAEKQGVESGWVFTKVGDVPLKGMDLEKIVSLILTKSIHLPMDK